MVVVGALRETAADTLFPAGLLVLGTLTPTDCATAVTTRTETRHARYHTVVQNHHHTDSHPDGHDGSRSRILSDLRG